MMTKLVLVLGIVVFPQLSGLTDLSQWKINSTEAKVEFVIKNAGLNVKGTFSDLKGDIIFDDANPSNNKITASVGVATVDTGIGMRNKSLVGEDYFEASTYPRISFVSSRFEKTKNGYTVDGKLTIKNSSKNVQIPFTFDSKVFKGNFNIDRLDYGVGKSSWIMGDKVKISFEIPVSKAG